MSIIGKCTMLALAGASLNAIVSLVTVDQAQARPTCVPSSLGRPVCANPGNVHHHPSKCYYLPTVSGGRVTGARQVCS